jgi:FAD:protein FMN transferase
VTVDVLTSDVATVEAVTADAVGVAQWSAWSTTARLVVTDPAMLAEARVLVQAELDLVDRACSRFRPDSELVGIYRAGGAPVVVSERLAALVAAALQAAERTDGDVDPTVGAAMRGLGYDRDIDALPPPSAEASAEDCGGAGRALVVTPAPGWRHVRLDATTGDATTGDATSRGATSCGAATLTVPAGVELDLGATAKAWTADYCADLVARRCRVGALVSLGGDIATAGPAPEGGWRVQVQDRPGDPSTTVVLPAGAAMASSSTVSRRWGSGGRVLHHVLDPRSGLPVPPIWRTATVAAPTCLAANTITTAALVRGLRAPAWLRRLGAPARLVSHDGRVMTLGGWPHEEEN